MIGSVLNDKYLIHSLLGKGGMGEVYEAEDTSTGVRVALKLIHVSGPTELAEMLPRFRREAKAAMVIDSSHIARTIATGVDPTTNAPFMVMELLTGEDLQQLLRRIGPLPPAVALRIVAQACQGLVDAHASGVVHRDIKPGNLFLVRGAGAEGAGGDITVKILDFGIAKLGEMYEAETAVLTRTGSMLGSPLYMSPEQARGIKNIDHRTDLWSLGVVLYCALSGRTPNQDIEAFGDLIIALCSHPATPIQDIAPWVSPGVAALIDAALQIRPDRRFPSAAAMLDALRSLLPDGFDLCDEMLVPLAETERSAAAPQFETTVLSTDFDQRTRREPSNGRGVAISIHDETAPSLPGEPAPAVVPSSTQAAAPAALRASAPDAAPASTPSAAPVSTRGADRVLAPVSTRGADRVSAPAADRDSTLAAAPDAPARRPRSWRALAAVLGALIAAALGAGFFLNSREAARSGGAPPAASVSAATAASVAPSSTAMTGLPPPTDCAPAALAEYRLGMQALHDGVWEQAHPSFERAVAADPACAEAQLRLAMTGTFHYSLGHTREVYRRAVQLRGNLQERDRLLLDALDAIVRRDPPDHQEYGARLRQLAAQFPGDAELICLASFETDNLDTKLAGLRRAIELDPQYSDAFQGLGHALDEMGKTDEAVAAFDDCIRAAPNSVDCVQGRIGLYRRTGRCAAMVSDAKLWIARDPATPNGYLALAGALAASGSSSEMVEEVLRQRASKLSEPERSQAQLFELALLDALRGEFDRAAGRARALQKLVEPDPNLAAHVRATLLLVEILLETNESARAIAIASDFQKRKGAWSVTATEVDTPIESSYLELRLLGAQRRAGRIQGAAWQSARDAWIDGARRDRSPAEETLTTLGLAMLATTPEEAVEALRTMPTRTEPVSGDTHSKFVLSGALFGRMLLLAGHVDEALPYLRSAAESCLALSSPFMQTRAQLWLGQTLEAKKDKPGACAAYRVVEGRWGSATPPSETARRARERSEALGCGR